MPSLDAAFYFDLASPLAYLASERVLQTLPLAAEWQPVLARELPDAESFDVYRCEQEQLIFRSELERRAAQLGLQAVRWPMEFPFDSELAMLAATYAKSIGRVVPFAQAAFRQAFAGGHSLSDMDIVLIAGAACEMHPRALIQSTERDSMSKQLRQASASAAALGIKGVPAVRIGNRVFEGEESLEVAKAYADALRDGEGQ